MTFELTTQTFASAVEKTGGGASLVVYESDRTVIDLQAGTDALGHAGPGLSAEARREGQAPGLHYQRAQHGQSLLANLSEEARAALPRPGYELCGAG